VKGEAGGAAEKEGVAGQEAHGARRAAPLRAAEAEQPRVAEGEGEDGSIEILLVAVLVQALCGRSPRTG
jgi:hypothetical protein